jgi:hypothetical protein
VHNPHNPNPDILDDPAKQAARMSFREISAQVRGLATMFGLCTISSPSSAAPEYWPVLADDDAEALAELERRVRVLFGYTGGALHGTHAAHVIKAWCVKNLGQDAREINRKVREEAAAVGAYVDPNDIVHSK